MDNSSTGTGADADRLMKFLKYVRSLPRGNKISLILLILLIFSEFIRDNGPTLSLQLPNQTSKNSQSCIELRPQDDTFQEAVVRAPGNYCIGADFWQRRFCGAGHCAPAAYRHLLHIGGGDVTIDLMNNTLHSDGHSTGIVAYTQSNKNSVNIGEPNYSFTQRTTRVTIKNGVIDLRGSGIGVEFVDKWQMLFLDTPVPGSITDYEKTEFILENLRIITDHTGVILEGDGNIIRSCVIESNGPAAIMMAGPNGLIEGNTIILNKKTFSSLKPFTLDKIMEGLYNPKNIYDLIQEAKLPKAAIVLHQAKNTIIRKKQN